VDPDFHRADFAAEELGGMGPGAKQAVPYLMEVLRSECGKTIMTPEESKASMVCEDAKRKARDAIQSALSVWKGVDSLNADLKNELSTTLNIGIGLHFGTAVVGWVTYNESKSLQFLGDTGNVAAKLEAQSKNLNCKMVVSLTALDAASISAEALERTTVPIPGQGEPMNVAAIRQRHDLERALEQRSIAII